MFSEVIGLALRYRVQCPVEVSLVPKAIRREQDFNKRKPYLVAAMVAILIIPLVSWLVNRAKADLYSLTYEKLQTQLQTLDAKSKDIKREQAATEQLKEAYQEAADLLAKRHIWPSVLEHLESLRPADVWFDAVQPIRVTADGEAAASTRRARPSEGPQYDFLAPPPGSSGARNSNAKADLEDRDLFAAVHIHGNAIQVEGLDEQAPGDAATVPAGDGTTSRQAVELRLLKELRDSALFKEDPDATKIIRYDPPETFLNYSRFVIRAEFETPQDLRIEK